MDTSSYNAFNYKAYSESAGGANNYNWPSAAAAYYPQQQSNQNKIVLVNPYPGNTGYNSENRPAEYTTPKPVTYKPFISLFGNSASTFGATANKIINNVVSTRRGFRFGTLYL